MQTYTDNIFHYLSILNKISSDDDHFRTKALWREKAIRPRPKQKPRKSTHTRRAPYGGRYIFR